MAEVAFDEDIASADLLEQTTLDLYHAGQLSVSGSDWDYIFSHRQPWRACKNAAGIVVKRRSRIEEIAQMATREMIDAKKKIFQFPIKAD